ncbi:hypothetical protein TNCV_4321171 [Trichonephila clavipes]|uniref:Uncharacterized protein n=1 Tax=Trichonephila clavipes TaxID=2585209 RepID=A0A8X6SM48_TRICX|nr:hypothetical protein TNCV_4321171 [Trichonephila clavipes]
MIAETQLIARIINSQTRIDKRIGGIPELTTDTMTLADSRGNLRFGGQGVGDNRRVKQGIIDYHIGEMLKEDKIRPIQSSYASPVVLIRKNNGPQDSP